MQQSRDGWNAPMGRAVDRATMPGAVRTVVLPRWRYRVAAVLAMVVGLAQHAAANQIPTASSGGTTTASTTVTKTYPSGLTYTLTLSGGSGQPFQFDGQGDLNDSGTAVDAYYAHGISATAASSATRIRVYGPCTVAAAPCARGTVTIAFSQPVANPVLHVAGFGGSSPGVDHSPVFRLTSPASGVTLSGAGGSPTNMNITANAFTSGTLNGESDCNTAGTGAGCGSIRVNGTVTTLVFEVDLRVAGGNMTSGNFDTIGITATVDEDFSDAPTTGFNSAQAPSHIVGDLRLGNLIDADHVGVSNSTTSPFPVAAGADNNGANGDGADEDAISTFPLLTTASTSYSLTVPISGASKAGRVCGWIDFNRNNGFVAAERACASFVAGDTSVTLAWSSLPTLTAGNNYVRLRAGYTAAQFETADGKGRADSGEMEDYLIAVATTSLTLAKTWVNAATGDAATVSVTAPAATGTALVSVADTPSETDAGTAFAVARGSTYTITEAFTTGIPSGYVKTLICTGNTGTGAALAYTADALSGTLTVGSTATAIVCTFQNSRRTSIRLQKALPDGRAQSGDQFVLAMSGTGAPASVTTTGTGTTANGTLAHATATAGAVYTLSESGAGATALAQYTTTYACTNARAGGQTPSGSGTSFSVTPAAGDDLTCTFSNTVAPLPNFGACPAGMFLSQGPTNTTNTTLYDISTVTNPFTYPAIGQGATVYNAIGFNPVDNYLYGISFVSGTGNRLIRVGSDGATRDLGPVSGLATDNWVNGTFSDTGTLYVLAGDGSNALRAINVATNTATSITLSSSVEAADFAWIGGLIYAVQANGQLRAINPVNGQVTNIGVPTAAVVYGAVFGSPSGLFAVANDGSGFYSFDLTTGARTLISSAPGATVNDGANCPTAPIRFSADLAVTKSNTPAQGANDLPDDTYQAGEVRTYRIVVSNLGPFGVQNASVSDPVPAGISASTMSWTCASTSGGSSCGAASGTGALNDTGLDLPSGAVATYTVTLTVPVGFTGNLVNTVTVTPPANITDATPGNNTATDSDIQQFTDVAIAKTASAATVATGAPVIFTLTVSNSGTHAADGAQVLDPAVAGLACTTVSCTGAAGATCPASPTVAGLQTSPGLAIPALPAGGSVSLLLACTVTATGF